MSPSAWHDASGRDAGHDEMQARLWRKLSQAHSIERNADSSGPLTYDMVGVWVEYPFKLSRRGVAGFADIGARYRAVRKYESGLESEYAYYIFFELKPAVSSVGGVIRQCRATSILADRSLVDRHSGSSIPHEVVAVVYEDDPKAALLKELYPNVMLLAPEVRP